MGCNDISDLQEEINDLEEEVDSLIKSEDYYKRQYKLLTGVYYSSLELSKKQGVELKKLQQLKKDVQLGRLRTEHEWRIMIAERGQH